MLNQLRERAENRLSELSREYFMHHAGFKPDLAMAPIVKQYEDLMAPEAQTAIRTAWEQAADPELKQQLGYLYGDCLRNVLRRELASPGDALGKAEATAEVRYGDEMLSYPQASLAIGRATDRARRKGLSQATREVSATLNPAREAVLATEHRLVTQELGFPHYRAFYEMVRGIDFAAMGPQMTAFLAATEALYQPIMRDWVQGALGLALEATESHDVTFLRRASNFDAAFPAASLVPALEGTLRDLGLEPTSLTNITMDLDNRPGKSSRAFCMGVRIPDEVYLCITPGGGPDDYQALLHEMGHALHFSHASRELPFEFRFMGDNSVCEAFAFNFEHITHEPAWLRRHLGLDEATIRDYTRTMARLHLFDLRRFAARHLFELQLHGEGALVDKGAIYADLLTTHTGVRYFPEDYLAATDGGFYTAQYFRAWCLEAQLKRVLKARFGEAWYECKEAGTFMKGLWANGQRLPGDALARHLGYDGVSPDVLLEDLTALLAE